MDLLHVVAQFVGPATGVRPPMSGRHAGPSAEQFWPQHPSLAEQHGGLSGFWSSRFAGCQLSPAMGAAVEIT
jgi:hypothetical protein